MPHNIRLTGDLNRIRVTLQLSQFSQTVKSIASNANLHTNTTLCFIFSFKTYSRSGSWFRTQQLVFKSAAVADRGLTVEVGVAAVLTN